VGVLHKVVYQHFLDGRVLFGTYHVADTFIHHKRLVVFEVPAIFRDCPDKLVNVWLAISFVRNNKHFFCQLGDLQESLTGHVLHSRVFFVHKLIQLLNNCF